MLSPSVTVSQTRRLASEVKFLAPPDTARQILQWAREHMAPDPFGSDECSDSYWTTTLYLDTPDLKTYLRLGSYKRSKFRIRRYGAASYAFLERKLKTRELVTKRRSMVPLPELGHLSDRVPDRGWAGFWFHRRLQARDLHPVCMVTYYRTARVFGTQEGPARLTLDRSISACPCSGFTFEPLPEATALSPDAWILELKYLISLPAPFRELIAACRLKPLRLSKYRLAVEALGLASAPSPGVPLAWRSPSDA